MGFGGSREERLAKKRAYNKEYYKRTREKQLEWKRIWREENRGYATEWSRQHRKKVKEMVFDHYGRSCQCCGETAMEFLTIDHIGGGGNKHREEIGRSYTYPWLVSNGFPDGFRTLCMNCNFAVGHGDGVCPHSRYRLESLLGFGS